MQGGYIHRMLNSDERSTALFCITSLLGIAMYGYTDERRRKLARKEIMKVANALVNLLDCVEMNKSRR